MLINPMLDQMQTLGLAGKATAYRALAGQSGADGLSRDEWLGLMLDLEIAVRGDKRLANRLAAALLRFSDALHREYRLRRPSPARSPQRPYACAGRMAQAHEHLIITHHGVGMMRMARRQALLSLLSVSYLVCYLDRMAMASAIPFIASEFQLSPVAMGGVLSAFFLGYALMQLPGGLLGDHFGPSRIIFASMLAWSVFTAATGLAHSLTALLFIRFCFGLSEGPFPASASKAIAMNFDRKHIGRANGILLSAVNVGAALSPLVIVPVVAEWGWRTAFYALFIPGVLLAPMFLRFRMGNGAAPDVNSAHQRRALGQIAREAMTAPGIVTCGLSLFFGNLAAWGLMNWLPTYLLDARGLTAARMSVVAPFPYLVGAAGYLFGGWLLDRKGVRLGMQIFITMAAGAISIAMAGSIPDFRLALAALLAAFFFIFVGISSLFAAPLLLSTQDSTGSAFGFVNTLASTAAFLSPLLVGYVLETTDRDFETTLHSLAIVALFSALIAYRLNVTRIAEASQPTEHAPTGTA